MYVNPDVKKTVRVFPRQGRKDFHRYDMNENPDTLPTQFVEEVIQEITPEFLSMYPEPEQFTQLYADSIGVDKSNVLATNGSDRGIRYLLEVFGNPSKDVVTVAPSFEMYRINCNILGLRHRPIPYEADLTFDFEKLNNAITENTGIVVLLNPNNPIGNVFTEEQVEYIVQKSACNGALVIIDEAYHHFYEKSFLSLCNKYKNVVILRTFSKIYSLAACRLGVVIADSGIIKYLHQSRLTFDINSIALLFGIKLIQRPEILDALKSKAKEGMAYLKSKLEEKGYEYIHSHGNFILIKSKSDATKLAKRLETKHKVLVHSYNNPLLKPYIRVSVGSSPTMQPFLDAFFKEDLEGYMSVASK